MLSSVTLLMRHIARLTTIGMRTYRPARVRSYPNTPCLLDGSANGVPSAQLPRKGARLLGVLQCHPSYIRERAFAAMV